MSVTTSIPCGPPTLLTQNVVYALPACRALLFCETTTATLVQSATQAMSTTAALTLSSGQAEVAGGFIKSTGGDVNVVLKKT